MSVSSEDALDDGSSSQGKAFLWVTSEDPIDPQLQPGVHDAQIIQRYILAVLYYATNGEGWGFNGADYRNDRWLGIQNECDWYTVTCSNSMVMNLYFPNNNLSGTIPSELGSLTNLEYLNLGANAALSGTIPSELGSLANLADSAAQFHQNLAY
eukprot:scaffold21131_cov194-Skeletonema_marinoi.AAC.9